MEQPKHGIEIGVETEYLAGRSDPARGFHFYAYTITITNRGSVACQLVSRHWVITDSSGREEIVDGPGVVGEQPVLEPGESFTYTSGCPLQTAVGAMRGFYRMVDAEGTRFEADIPAFALTQPQFMN